MTILLQKHEQGGDEHRLLMSVQSCLSYQYLCEKMTNIGQCHVSSDMLCIPN